MVDQPCDARAEGYDAYLAGKSETSNPYEVDDNRHLDWNDGFAQAAEENGDD